MNNNANNGWKNYETRAVATWLDRDLTSQLYWVRQTWQYRVDSANCQQVIDGIWTTTDAAIHLLAEQLKEEFTAGVPSIFKRGYTDLLNAALGEVDWNEIAEHFLAKTEAYVSENGPLIFAQPRTQAIADGLLVDVSEMAEAAGITCQIALTASVWQRYVVVPEGVEGQDERARLWDILWTMRHTFATQVHEKTSQFQFQVMVKNNNREPEQATLRAMCTVADQDKEKSVITVMLPHER